MPGFKEFFWQLTYKICTFLFCYNGYKTDSILQQNDCLLLSQTVSYDKCLDFDIDLLIVILIST